MLLRIFLSISFCLIQINCELKRFRRLEWHYKCRNDYYPGTDKKLKRWNIAEQEIKWIKKPFHPPYDPPSYTAKTVLDGPEWADPEMDGVWYESKPKWNLNVGGCYNRQCGVHVYLVNHSFPVNPIGRTGIKGRGLLGRWGPNHAVHVVVARYKKIDDNFVINPKTRQPELEFVSVKRADCGEWSVPGRFLRSREKLGLALKRCFIEECLNSLKSYVPKKRQKILTIINKLFADGPLIYRGYVDDPRNTDNAWVSSTVFLFFDTASNITEKFDLEPGRNILEVKWLDANRTYKKTFYANHEDFVEDACRHVDAYYPISESEERRLKKDYPVYDENSSLNVTDPEEEASYSVSSLTSNIKP